ncbi:MAG: leucine-rich repeat domain-containing protein [Oscillospiraceae bacterium]|nr:leucine-rich repeat domain-containing protein [Oscillospiraceae bacterium]
MKLFKAAVVIAVILAALLVPFTVRADTSEKDPAAGFTYEAKDGNIVITGYKGTDTELVIPSEIGGMPVTEIGSDAFYDTFSHSFSDFTSVKIPDTVVYIGDRAFCGCDHLESITIPSSVRYTGYGAFSYCTSLTSAVIEKGADHSVRRFAFKSCTSLTSVSLPDSIDKIEYEAFADCTSLTSIEIPESVTTIENQVFQGCTALESITIPDSVESIGDWLFRDCPSLSVLILPEGLETKYSLFPDSMALIRYKRTDKGMIITEASRGDGSEDITVPGMICGVRVISGKNDEDISSGAGVYVSPEML